MRPISLEGTLTPKNISTSIEMTLDVAATFQYFSKYGKTERRGGAGCPRPRQSSRRVPPARPGGTGGNGGRCRCHCPRSRSEHPHLSLRPAADGGPSDRAA